MQPFSENILKDYYSLTKAGLVYGNLITVIAGFALGSATATRLATGDASVFASIDFATLIATLVGIAFVMASGCVFNNYIDRDIDAKMPRTKERVLVTGKISSRAAMGFALVLGVIGFTTLGVFTNPLTVAIAFAGFFAYVVLYSLWAKRRTAWGAEVGSIAGATPPVVGYVAAAGHLDLAALLLFAIIALWQMPHFFAIAIRRADDYAAAKIPVLPVARGIRTTKIAMLIYIIAFIVAALSLALLGYAGNTYLAIALLLGLAWLALGVSGFNSHQGFHNDNKTVFAASKKITDADKVWARKMFFLSLIVMVTLFATITIGAII